VTAGRRNPAAWRRYLRFWGSNIPDDVDAEIAFHMEMRIDEYVARGMTRADARRAVLDRLGDVDSAKAESIRVLDAGARDARNASVLESLAGDFAFAVRSLRRSPGWTTVVLLTIALGVGATTAVFSVADSLLLRPLDYPDASHVVVISREVILGSRSVMGPMRLDAVHAWQAGVRTLEQIQPFSRTEVQLGAGADASTIDAGVIDTGFFAFAGAHPIIGRAFTAADILPNSQKVLLLSEGLWRSRFGAARDVVGTTTQIGSETYTIVGVAPATLMLPELDLPRSDVWLPFVVHPNERTTSLLARTASGGSAVAAAAELQAILDRTGLDPMAGLTTAMSVRRPTDTFGFRRALLMLSGAVALLLLVSCINLAHLLLARGVSRERELAVRYALGAGRSRLIRLLVMESLIVAAAGGAIAVFVGWAGLRLLAASHPAKMFAFSHVTPDRSLVIVAAVVACVAGISIGMLTALRTARAGIAESLRGATFSSNARGSRLRSTLVIGEVALSAVLLVGALLLIHAVYDLQRTRLGFDVHHLFSVTFDTRTPRLAQPAQRAAFAELLRTEARRLPGVDGVTIADIPPINSRRLLASLESEEHPAPPDAPATATPSIAIANDFFRAMRMRLIAGRPFNSRSAADNETIISQTLARSLWPDGDAVGRRFRQAAVPGFPATGWWTVIGVVPDVVTHSLLDTKPEPAIYRAIADDWDMTNITLIVRVAGGDAAGALRRLSTSVQPGPTMPRIRDLERELNETAAEPRFTMVVLITFAALAVVLAATGLYGVIAYAVAQRTREIGVRIALGATRPLIARLVVGNGLRLAVSGVVVGLAGSVAATRVIEHLLYGVSRFDAFAFAGGAVFLVTVSGIACVVPMLRATAVDPVVALRTE
jgi:putative ABC transport system permease protein